MNEVTITQNTQVTQGAEVNYLETANRYLATVGQNIPANKVQEFLEIAQLKKLNPFAREIHLVGYGDKWNIITGYEVFLKRAESNPAYDGFEFNIDSSNPNDISGTITIYRKDRTHDFKHTVYMNEVIGVKKDGNVNSMWQKMARFMLKKVAIAQGFRLCFPLDFGDMPYTSDEIPNEQNEQKAPQQKAPQQQAQSTLAQESKAFEEKKKINEEIKNLIESTYPDGTAVFTEEDKAMYREMYRKDKTSTLASMKILLQDRLSAWETAPKAELLPQDQDLLLENEN